jgi:formylglycine-generating enzyme required for sulfatase activity
MNIIKGSSRIIRGGSWYNGDSYCAVSYRYINYPYERYSIIGFRVAIGGVI